MDRPFPWGAGAGDLRLDELMHLYSLMLVPVALCRGVKLNDVLLDTGAWFLSDAHASQGAVQGILPVVPVKAGTEVRMLVEVPSTIALSIQFAARTRDLGGAVVVYHGESKVAEPGSFAVLTAKLQEDCVLTGLYTAAAPAKPLTVRAWLAIENRQALVRAASRRLPRWYQRRSAHGHR